MLTMIMLCCHSFQSVLIQSSSTRHASRILCKSVVTAAQTVNFRRSSIEKNALLLTRYRHISSFTRSWQLPAHTQQQAHSFDDTTLVSSTQSNTVKKIKQLLQKRKKRTEFEQTIVEGPRMVLDLLQNPHTRHLVHTVLVDEEKMDEYSTILLHNQNAKGNDDNPINLLLATRQVLQACSDTVTPQGIVAIVDIPQWNLQKHNSLPPQLNKEKNAAAPLFLILDAVSDPGNTGTLIRTAVATGVSGIIQLPGCCDIWNPKAIRSAMTASFLMPSYAAESWDELQQQLSEQCGVQNFWAATMMEGSDGSTVSSAHFDVDWKSSASALIVGSEGSGLSQEIRESIGRSPSLQAVHVPMQPGIESLNAAVCGSVIMFEYLRQNTSQQSS